VSFPSPRSAKAGGRRDHEKSHAPNNSRTRVYNTFGSPRAPAAAPARSGRACVLLQVNTAPSRHPGRALPKCRPKLHPLAKSAPQCADRSQTWRKEANWAILHPSKPDPPEVAARVCGTGFQRFQPMMARHLPTCCRSGRIQKLGRRHRRPGVGCREQHGEHHGRRGRDGRLAAVPPGRGPVPAGPVRRG
jgi:hypothetical protein